MQIICGQCRHRFSAIDGPAASCPKCGHEILIGDEAPPAAEVEVEADDFASVARNTMERKVQVTCARCNKTLTVGARLAGKRRKCPACQGSILIPYPDEKEDFATLGTLAALAAEMDTLDLVTDDKGQLTEQDEAESAQAQVGDLSARSASAPAIDAPQPRRAAAPAAPHAADGAKALPAAAAPKESAAPLYSTPMAPGPAALRPPSRFSGMLAGGVVLITMFIAGGVYLAYQKLFTGPGPELVDLSTPAPTPAISAATPAPAPTPTPRPGASGAPSPSASVEPTASVRITETVRSAFMGEGFHPAAPTNLYWILTMEVSAGTYAVAIHPAQDVFLSIDGAEVAALGTLTSGFMGPAVSNQAVNIKPQQSGAATFIFEVPQRLTQASLRVRNAAAVPITMEAYRGDGELAGSFMEASPRNLPPLPRDPILAAIVACPQVTLRISPSGDYQLQLPGGITGTAKKAQVGLYTATLTLGDASLPCKLRLLEGAKILILYFQDEPFHQITFARE